jgi:hypothetical protein
LNDRRPNRFLPIAFAGVFALGLAASGSGLVRAQAPPPPPVPNPSATPLPAPTLVPTAAPTQAPTQAPSPSPRGRRGGRPAPAASGKPEPTATPTSPAFASLDGTWEVEVQYPDHTNYSYMVLRQRDSTLSGTWRLDGKEYPLQGTYDGRLIRMSIKQTAGEVALSGYVENASDMVGLVDYGKGTSPAFTAEHRGPPPHGLLQRN